jgi:hypothetical protein
LQALRPLRSALLPALVYLAGYVALTWPLLLKFGSEYFSDAYDGWQNVWNIWWIRKALLEQHSNPWWTDLLYHPNGITLIALPLQPLLGRVATFNILIVFAFVAGGWFAYLLAFHLTRHRAGSLFAGAAFTFSHFHFSHASCQMQMTTLQYIPLFLLAWLRLLERPSAARGLMAGGAFVLVWLSDLYYVLYCVLFAAVLFAREAWLRRSPWFFLQSAPRAAFLVFLPLVTATAGVHGVMLLRQDSIDPLRGEHQAALYSADLTAAFVPSEAWRFSNPEYGGFAQMLQEFHLRCGGMGENEVYLGWSVLVLAALGIVRTRAPALRVWLLLASLAFVLSLGPVIRCAGAVLWSRWTPYNALGLVFPPLRLAGCPGRFAVMTTLATGVLAAWGVASLRGRERWLLAPLLVLFAFEMLPRRMEPPFTSRLEPDEVIEELATLPPGAVHEAAASDFDVMARQTLHERPIPGGYVSRWPRSRYEQLEYLTSAREQKRYAELLRRLSVRYLVLPTAEITAIEQRELVPLRTAGNSTILVLPEDPLAPSNGTPPPRLACTDLGPGNFDVVIESAAVAGLPFACAFAGARGMIPLGPAGVVPLGPDELLWASLAPADPRFLGANGRAGGDGRVHVRVRLGPEWSGKPLFFALVAWKDEARTAPVIVATGSWRIP